MSQATLAIVKAVQKEAFLDTLCMLPNHLGFNTRIQYPFVDRWIHSTTYCAIAWVASIESLCGRCALCGSSSSKGPTAQCHKASYFIA